jgi:hypothetical protein
MVHIVVWAVVAVILTLVVPSLYKRCVPALPVSALLTCVVYAACSFRAMWIISRVSLARVFLRKRRLC